MKISIVVPVYNEAERLAACLDAIERQNLPAYEVIVVDNNSDDGTDGVARRYDFVRLIKEPRQGVVHARNNGFDAARGDIIGRIDADTVLSADWTVRLQSLFGDPDLSAVSGSPHYYDFALDNVADSLDLVFRRRLARKLGDQNFLWGANMALRRSAWLKVRHELCGAAEMHEDFDLGIHLQGHGLRVDYAAGLVAGVSARRIDTGFWAYLRYTLVSPKTYALHRLKSRRHMYPVLLVCWLAYFPGRLIYRCYDPVTRELSFRQLWSATQARVDPTANIV